MDLKLDIYNKKQVEKTYTAETYFLMFKTIKKLVKVIDFDKLDTGNDVELIKNVSGIVINGFDIIEPLLKDIFDGLTDEEIERARVEEIAVVLIKVVKLCAEQIGKAVTSKN